ncbi:hypothetical protein psal_cds_1347 [Pandoravirus salinus]|uniref:Uncharacterized protein n=1 Tax=Pandoravirus salinus TaxID=1349410 RepID=S4W5S8_9VIRU|nr:hypothetical protein psal_cds_1347 [Pandoravirus salinus]AGO85740.1 hypothetical protein psal_cds_1347 [Pandoravirus salinus]
MQPRDTKGDNSGTINDALCDDLLYRILVFDVGVGLLPLVSRVCVRWRSIAAEAPASLRDDLIERTAALCVESRASPPALLCGWAARTRTLASRVGPHLVHSGHLVDAVLCGHGDVIRWIRGQQHPWVECDPEGRDDRRYHNFCENDPASYDFCPRCGRGREADAWPWACAASQGNPRAIVDDVNALVAVRGRLTERQRDCWMPVLDRALIDLATHGNADAIGFLVDEQLVRTRHYGYGDFTIWAAAAATGRLDLLKWGHATEGDRKDYPRLGMVASAASQVMRYAASSGHVEVIEWVMDTHRERDEWFEDLDHDIYWSALEGGRTNVLDWLVSKRDASLRVWDYRTSGNFFGESPWRALLAPDASSLRWLHARGVTIPIDLVECARGDDEYVMDRLELAGSPETVAYAVDVCGCRRPNAKALRMASAENRLDLVRQAAERGWIDTEQLWGTLLTKAVDNCADSVSEWIASFHAAHTSTTAGSRGPVPSMGSVQRISPVLAPARPFSTKWDFADPTLHATMVLRHAAGAPWAGTETLVSRGTCASAASILWALSKGCPMPRGWGKISRRAVMAACASALSVDAKSTRRRHKPCLDLDVAMPLDCMTKSDAAAVRAWIDTRRLVRRLARSPPGACDPTGSIVRDAHALSQGSLSEDLMERLASAFWSRVDRPLAGDEHRTRMLSKRRRARLRHKRSRTLGYLPVAVATL